MNKEIRISIVDLLIGYGCSVVLINAVGAAAYMFGKSRAKIELVENLEKYMNREKYKSYSGKE